MVELVDNQEVVDSYLVWRRYLHLLYMYFVDLVSRYPKVLIHILTQMVNSKMKIDLQQKINLFYIYITKKRNIFIINNIQEQFELNAYQILLLAVSFVEAFAFFLLFHVVKKYFLALFVVMFEVVSKPILLIQRIIQWIN